MSHNWLGETECWGKPTCSDKTPIQRDFLEKLCIITNAVPPDPCEAPLWVTLLHSAIQTWTSTFSSWISTLHQSEVGLLLSLARIASQSIQKEIEASDFTAQFWISLQSKSPATQVHFMTPAPTEQPVTPVTLQSVPGCAGLICLDHSLDPNSRASPTDHQHSSWRSCQISQFYYNYYGFSPSSLQKTTFGFMKSS